MGGSASRASGDQSSTDPGGGFRRNKQRKSNWRIPTEKGKRDHWAANSQEFPSLETQQRTAGYTKRSAGLSAAEVGRRPTGPPTPVPRNLDRGMRRAEDFQSVPPKDRNTQTRGVQETIVTPLSALAESFSPRKTSRKPPTPQMPMDNVLDRSFPRTGQKKMETPQDIIEIEIATVVAASPSEIERPVAVADVAEADGPVVTGTRFRSVIDVAEASGPAVTRTASVRQSVQHEMITKDVRPVRCGPRRLAPAGLRKEQDCVQDMLTGGQIEPSDSPWASPVVLVTKKDGLMCFCVDYRWLYSLTVKDAYPLPRIDDSLRLLGNQQWFSTMDLVSRYWQVAMSPEAKRKAAFVTNEGLFQFRVMPFGLCNAPATFERLMDRVLCGMHWSRCLVYLDDVISFGKSVPEALGRLEEVLARLSDFGLQLKAKKCTFMQTEVAFLGHIVGQTSLACDPEKLSAVRNWHEPNRVKAVRQFVGFIGYYRRFVKKIAELADPLVALTRKGVPFMWGDEQQTAFDAPKACLLSAPILGFPTEKDRFALDTDASLFAIGGVLSQIQNEEEVVIDYASRSLRTSAAPILYHSSRNASGSGHVYTLPAIPTGQSVYPENGP